MWQSQKCENSGMSHVIEPQILRGVPATVREQGGAEREQILLERQESNDDNLYIWFLASLEISLFTVTDMLTASLLGSLKAEEETPQCYIMCCLAKYVDATADLHL